MRWLLALSLLTGCLHRYEPLRIAAKAERSDQPDAESLWHTALRKPLATIEWRTAHRHLCRLRQERIGTVSQAITPTQADRAQVRAMRVELEHCNGARDLKIELARLEEEAALARFEALQPTEDFQQVYDGWEPIRLLSDEAPQRSTYTEWRDAWTRHLRALPRPGPGLALQLDRLLADAVGGDVDERAMIEATTVYAGDRTLRRDSSCAAWIEPSVQTGSTAKHTVSAVHTLSNCRTSTSKHRVDVPYQVKRYRTELQNQKQRRTRTVNVSKKVATGTTNCYQTSDSYQTCFPQWKWTSVPTTEVYYIDVQVEVDVPFFETELRKEDRFRRTVEADLLVETTSEFGTDTRTLALTHSTDAKGSAAPASRVLTAGYEDQVRSVQAQSIDLGAQWLFSHLMNRSDLVTPEGIDARLLAARSRPLTRAERSTIASTLSIPVASLQPNRPAVHDIEYEHLAVDAVAEPMSVDADGVLKFGFPFLTATLGGGRSTGFDALPTHDTPRSYQGIFREEAQYGLVARTPVGQFGFHFSVYGAAHYGWRSQKAYVFPDVDSVLVSEDAREPKGARDFHGGAQALIGSRNAVFGLFAGVHPRAFYGRIGYATTGGTALPLLVRFEFRPVPRMPFVLSAWGYDLARPDERFEHYGANVMIPLTRGVWFTAEHSRGLGRTQVRGLTEDDRIELGRSPWTRTWAGLSLGM